MTEEKMSPLRARMIEDMRIRGMSPKTQQAHIRAVRYFAEFIGRSPDRGRVWMPPVLQGFLDLTSSD